MANIPPDNYLKTLNKTGVSTRYLDTIAQAGIEFSRGKKLPVLDMGCGYGSVSRALLRQGNSVIANDLDQRHLIELKASLPSAEQKSLTLLCGKFPTEVNLPPATVSAVISSWMIHFLSGPELKYLSDKLFSALVVGGKVFLSASSPYLRFLSEFIPVYEKQKLYGAEFPGWLADVSQYLQPHQIENLPPSMHFLDPALLKRIFTQAGFEVEYAEFFRRDDVTEGMALDGRENVGIIARKPEIVVAEF